MLEYAIICYAIMAGVTAVCVVCYYLAKWLNSLEAKERAILEDYYSRKQAGLNKKPNGIRK